MIENFFTNLNQCYIIAEIGVNHNGNMSLAREMIDAAKKSGADAVKFQTFTAETLVAQGTPKVKYQQSTTSPDESHYEMIHKLELKREDHLPLKEYSEKNGLDFISTPYDIDSAKFLNEIGIKLFKTASADLVDLPLQNYIANTGKPSLISVGMASLGEIEDVVKIYKKAENHDLIFLHCVSNYPCSDDSLNLRVLKTINQAFQYPIGYSDHSIGSIAAIMSIVLGARVIEKHFTLDNNLPGPDHKASSTPDEFEQIVISVRRAEKILGDGIKECQKEEKEMAQVSRKSIIINKDTKKNDIIQLSDLSMKRPGTGLEGKYINYFVGKKINNNIKKGTFISWDMLQKNQS
jgi:N,N'-diacetyllegionaminate synthase